MIPFYARDAAYKIQFIESAISGNITNFNIFHHLAFAQVLIYLIATYRMLALFTKKIKQNLATLDIVNLDWIRHLVSIIFISFVLCFPLFILYFLGIKLENIINVSYLAALFVCFGVLLVGYRTWLQPDNFYDYQPEEREKKYQKSILSSEESTVSTLIRDFTPGWWKGTKP